MKHKLLLILLTFISASVFGQFNDGGNGVQYKYTGDYRDVRQILKAPQPPFAITDSLKKLEALINKKDFLSTGLIDHAALSATVGQTTFNISAGHGIVANFNNHYYPSIKRVNITAKTGITPAFLTTAITSYIAIDSNNNVVQSASPFTDVQSRDLIILGAIIHSNLTNINAVNNIAKPVISNTNQLHDLYEAIGALNTAGNKYTANGANLNINKSAGNLFKLGVNFINDWKSPSKLTLSAQTALTFRYRTRTGSEGSDVTAISPGFYDVAGTVTAIPGGGNQFTIQHITIFQSGLTRIQYGQNVYANKTDAMAALSTESFVTETNIAENGIFRAYLVVRKNATQLNDLAQAEFIEVGKFGSPIGNAGGAVTSANIIAALGYTPENVANKATDFTTVNNTLYPSVQAVKNYADGLVAGLLDDRGSYNASSNVFPSTGGSGTAGAIMKGDIWAISASGTLGGVAVNIGDWVRALTDSPAQTAANWSVVEGNLGYTPENVGNKATDFGTPTNTTYPTTLAVKTLTDTKQPQLNGTGFVKASGTTISYDNSSYALTGGSNATGNWPISISGNASTVTSYVGSGAGTRYIPWLSAPSGTNQMNTSSNFTWDHSTGVLSAPTFTGALNGNAATATTATNFGGLPADFSGYTTSPYAFPAYDASLGKFRLSDATAMRTYLGSPSGGETLQSVTDRGASTTNILSSPRFLSGISNKAVMGGEVYGLPAFYGLNSINGAQNILINPDGGNVNAGYTTDQGYKLAVNGTGFFSGNVSSTSTGSVFASTGSSTSPRIMNLGNTGGTMLIGVENSAGNSTLGGSSAYAGIVGTAGNTPLEFFTNNAKRLTISGAGDATFSGSVTAQNAQMSAWSTTPSTYARFGHKDFNTGSNYGFLQRNDGFVFMEAPSVNITAPVNITGALSATSYSGGATLTGAPTAPTATAGDNSTKIATTAFVQNAVNSGTYTPTLTAGSNTASVTNNGISHYTKNGNEVTVFGSLTVTPTAGVSAGTNTIFSISLPIASDFTNGDDLFGHGSALYNNGGNNVSYSSSYVASPANNDCSGAVMAFTTNAITIRYSFMYTIK